MSETWRTAFLFSGMGVMTILFWIVFAIIVRYLISVFRLIRQVKMSEPDLWTSLGSPTMFPMFHVSANPFIGLSSQMRFCNWFLKGGEGAESAETKAMVAKTRRLFGMATIGFVGLFALFLLFFGILLLVMGTKGAA